jgi:hypothetical protein
MTMNDWNGVMYGLIGLVGYKCAPYFIGLFIIVCWCVYTLIHAHPH